MVCTTLLYKQHPFLAHQAALAVAYILYHAHKLLQQEREREREREYRVQNTEYREISEESSERDNIRSDSGSDNN